LSFLQGIFSRVKGWFAEIWEKTEKRDRTRFLVISGIAVTLIIAAMVMLNNSRYTKLAGASPNQMFAATSALSEGGVRYRTSGEDILVHRNDHGDALAILGQTASNNADITFNLEIYAEATGLTATESDRRAYSAYQIQDNLKRVLEGMPMIDTAAVMIKNPSRQQNLFITEIEPTTAAVTLWRNAELSPDMVDAIVNLVHNASGAALNSITITDQYAVHLNKPQDENDITGVLERNLAYKQRIEKDYATAVNRQLGLLYGAGNYYVNVFADIDFDVYTSEEVTFTPVVGNDEGIPRSTQESSEFARGLNMPGGFPGTDENGLGMDADEYAEVLEEMRSEYRRNQIITNFEINQLNEFLSRTPGQIKNLTVSVSINSDGLEEVDRNPSAVEDLVRASVGLSAADASRNVVVEYLRMPGVREASEQYDKWMAAQQRDKLMELIRTLVLYLVIGLCFLLLIYRTFELLKPKPLELGEELFAGDAEDYADMLEAAQGNMELEVTKTPTRERIEEFIDSNPEAVASMLRNWLLGEESRGW
jgi:flagellar M-ring protein FliF